MDAADFIQLATQGDIQQALRELRMDPSLATEPNSQGVALVCRAVYHPRPELAGALASARADLDILDATSLGGPGDA
jgi:hypothetical protein